MRRHKYINLFLLFNLLIFLISSPKAKAFEKGILIVTDHKTPKIFKKELLLKKHLSYYRKKYGRNSKNLPIFIYNFSRKDVKSYVFRKFNIKKNNLLFLGIVKVKNKRPEEIISRINNVNNLEEKSHFVIRNIVGKKQQRNIIGTGGVKIYSKPSGAKIYLDGIYYGKTPRLIRGLKTGNHILTLRKTLYKKIRKSIIIERGQTISYKIPLLENFAHIFVKSAQGEGKVYIDGVYKGKTPLTIKKVLPGKHSLVIIKGYDEWKKQIKIKKGERLSFTAYFKKKNVITNKTNTNIKPKKRKSIISFSNETIKETFIPRVAQNSIFQVIVSNLEEVDSIKKHYKPKSGYKFVILYISQHNISDLLQVYTGKFFMKDQGNSIYKPIQGLSHFWAIVLKSGGMRTGYLVFEIPIKSKAITLILKGSKTSPLEINLK